MGEVPSVGFGLSQGARPGGGVRHPAWEQVPALAAVGAACAAVCPWSQSPGPQALQFLS